MKGLIRHALVALSTLLLVSTAIAQPVGKGIKKQKSVTGSDLYIVVLEGQSVPSAMASRSQVSLQRAGSAPLRPDMNSVEAQQHVRELDEQFDRLRTQAVSELGRELSAESRFHYALNGFTTSLTASEAKRLAKMPGVRRVEKTYVISKESYAGPIWVGADTVWNGEGSLPISRGEGVIVGIIDSGANWDHISFADPSSGVFGHDHTNPYGSQLGLCSDPDVECNDKLVGVYDFVQDNPNTDTVEEFNNGRDNGEHGAHVASTVAGNPASIGLGNSILPVSGVAPNANVISYRVCFAGDPDDPDDDGCFNSQIVEAINQAIADEVDVINMSLGGGQFSPWQDSLAEAYLNAYAAGIFVATSASNAGPADFSINNPANAPWMVAVGSATHNRIFGTTLNAFSGGDTTPPGVLQGASRTSQQLTTRDIVHAKDFGNALCGTGPSEDAFTCDTLTGSSNPFAPGTFNGEIVVCDRGDYGRIEKGNNLLEAGAGGYVLANTDANGESITSDNHCLPATHLGAEDSNELRTWLDSGSGHQGFISGSSSIASDDFGDRLSIFSSRGPNLPPAEDILKPNVIAPGDLIWAAAGEGTNTFIGLGGTSMSSPHVAGAGVLLKAIRPNWTPAMISSALQLTATMEFATDENTVPATRFEAGHGRIQIDEAAKAGIYLDETAERFANAGPGGSVEPRDLNLPSMTDAQCELECSFTRTLQPLVNDKTWTVTTQGFPQGATVEVSPQEFTLGNGDQQTLNVDVDLSGLEQFGVWLSGDVVLSAPGVPDAVMPVTVQAAIGELPESLAITSDRNSGHETFALKGVDALPQATFTAGGLALPEQTVEELLEDPTFSDPFDEGEGVFTKFIEVPPGTLQLFAVTSSPEVDDVDLFVGRDINGNGRADLAEAQCSSQSPVADEECVILSPSDGDWWVLVQNWENGIDPGSADGPPLEVLLETALISADSDSPLSAAGPGTTSIGETFELKLAWDNVDAVNGETLVGAVAIGSSSETPDDIGIIPVFFKRNGIASPRTLVMHPDRSHGLALEGESSHNRIVIDVPAGATSLTVSAEGATNTQSNNLELRLYRRNFGNAFGAAPALPPLPSSGVVASDTGAGGNGPSVTVSGDSLQAGRWHVELLNGREFSSSVRVTSTIGWDGADPLMRTGLWQPDSRPDIAQGLQYIQLGANRAVAWYTYDDDQQPTWYLAAGANPDGNVWTADVQRFTNDGTDQQSSVVGTMSVTLLAEDDMIFSWSLFGEYGSDRMIPSFNNTSCPDIGDGPTNYSGIWSALPEGRGGASIAMNSSVQSQTHYVFDDSGVPRWLTAPAQISSETFSLLQFTGPCPNCNAPVDNASVGMLTRDFDSESSGGWTLDYSLAEPLSSTVERTDPATRLSSSGSCE